MRLIAAEDLLGVAAGELPDRDEALADYEDALDAALRDVERALGRSFAVHRRETFARPTTFARPVGSTLVRRAAWAEAWPLVEVLTDPGSGGVVLARIEAVDPDPERRRLLVATGDTWPEAVEYYAGYRPTAAALGVWGEDEAEVLTKLQEADASLDELTVLPAELPADVVEAVCELALARLNVRRAGATGLGEKSERIEGNKENVTRPAADPLARAVKRLAHYRALI